MKKTMTSRQCEVAAEAYTASLLARSGYDVLVQYGANQPDYDLMADQDGRKSPISVKVIPVGIAASVIDDNYGSRPNINPANGRQGTRTPTK